VAERDRHVKNKPARQLVEHLSPRDLRLVVIECPLDGWGDRAVRGLFCDMVELKILGFGARYSAKVLPVDTTDFIGRHILSCVDSAEGLRAIAGFRAIDREQCRSFNLPFPAESLARAAGASRHVEAVRALLEPDEPLGYIGSWTVHPSVRDNLPLRAALRDHFALGAILLHREVGVTRLILGATLRFKVDRLLAAIGYRVLSHQGDPLPPIPARHLHGEQVQLMYLEEYQDAVLERAHGLRSLWEARVVF
jgi:hypothetical protein